MQAKASLPDSGQPGQQLCLIQGRVARVAGWADLDLNFLWDGGASNNKTLPREQIPYTHAQPRYGTQTTGSWFKQSAWVVDAVAA